MNEAAAIPRYFLYGEGPTEVERAFVHVETIERRSSVNDWTIRLHAHPDHEQVLLLSEGTGVAQLEEERIDLEPGSLVVVPSLVVHGYRFAPGSNGMVVTIARRFLQEAQEGDAALAAPFAGAGCCLHDMLVAVPSLLEAFQTLEREFVWAAIGRRIAVKAALQRIIVAIARVHGAAAMPARRGRRRDADLVVRFRALVECDFRRQPTLPAFAQVLGVTTASLNAACRACVGKSALTVMHDRLLIEAKRHLLYTGMSAIEISGSLGFTDAAYFNRFFSRRAGMTPGRFRASGVGEDGLLPNDR